MPRTSSTQKFKERANQYFEDTPPEQWSFSGFSNSLGTENTTFPQVQTLYKDALLSIKTKKKTSEYLKSLIGNLLEKAITIDLYKPKEGPTFNIGNHNNVDFVHSFNSIGRTESPPQQRQQQQQQEELQQQQEEPQQQQEELQQQQQPYYERQVNADDVEPFTSHVDSNSKFRAMTTESLNQFKAIYRKMDDTLKWKFDCSDRYVEDVLYAHGLTLKKENCLHSFILDLDDDEIRGLFSSDEWEEMLQKNVKEDPALPDNVEKLLHDFNKTNLDDIYTILKDSERRYEDFNTQAISYAIESLLLLLQSNPNPLMSQQLEQWYQAHIWTPLTDKMLSDLPGVICVLGESASVSSKERKRQHGKHHLGRMGSRNDMIIRKTGNGVVLEYGAAEDAVSYDGSLGKKRMHEVELKLPKTLKDMLMRLCDDCNWDTPVIRSMEVIGYCHSGTVAEFMVMDSPSGYICRLLRTNYYQVPNTIAEISKLLTLLAVCLRMKLRISRSIASMNKLSLDLDSTTLAARKRKASKSLADTLDTPPRPSGSYQRKKRNPYFYD